MPHAHIGHWCGNILCIPSIFIEFQVFDQFIEANIVPVGKFATIIQFNSIWIEFEFLVAGNFVIVVVVSMAFVLFRSDVILFFFFSFQTKNMVHWIITGNIFGNKINQQKLSRRPCFGGQATCLSECQIIFMWTFIYIKLILHNKCCCFCYSPTLVCAYASTWRRSFKGYFNALADEIGTFLIAIDIANCNSVTLCVKRVNVYVNVQQWSKVWRGLSNG